MHPINMCRVTLCQAKLPNGEAFILDFSHYSFPQRAESCCSPVHSIAAYLLMHPAQRP